MKQVEIVQSDMNGDIDVDCVFTPGSGTFGQASVDDSLMASHTQGTANDVFTLEDGLLKVEGVQGIYGLEEGNLYAYSNVTASAKVFTEIPNKVVSFQYNAEGLRTKKTMTLLGRVTETEYILHGKLVTEMIVRKYDAADPTEITEENVLHFFYDAQSRPAMVMYNGITYRYLHNLQGDIVAILDSNGNAVVEYRYDEWGMPIAIVGSLNATLGSRNPFRYRGYIYDEETGLYYLRSRYYNPAVGRFVNADDIIKPKALLSSVYAYCANEPVVRVDYSGKLYLSIELYTIALSTPPLEKYDFSNTLLAMKFTKRIRASNVVRERIIEYIKAIPKGKKSYSRTESIGWEFGKSLKSLSNNDLDLALAVGHASDMTITVEKVDKGFLESIFFWGDKYKVTYTLKDTYDFDRWAGTDREAALIWLNDTLGYEPQEAGILNEYSYTCTDSYYIYAYN